MAGDGPAVWDGISVTAGVGTPGVGEEDVDWLQARAAARTGIVRKASRSFMAEPPRGEHRHPVAGGRDAKSLPPAWSRGVI